MNRLHVWVFLVLIYGSLCSKYDDPGRRHYGKRHSKRAAEVDWWGLGQAELRHALNLGPIIKPAKNVILFLGDGMGISTVSAARFYSQQSRGRPLEDVKLTWETFPNVALSKTYNTNGQTSDSAGTATAFLTGEKAQIFTVGVNQRVKHKDCLAQQGNEVKSILEHSIDEDKWTGFVTNTRVTHATVSATYAHSASRWWEGSVPEDIPGREHCADIAKQLVDGENNKKIRVILGGGRKHLLPGSRPDGRNLLNDWKKYKLEDGWDAAKYKLVQDKHEFDAIDDTSVEFLFGVFNNNYMEFEESRVSRDPPIEPSLVEMTEKAINVLKKGPEGYFLLVEGGRIDHAHHENWAFRALNETLALSDAVEKAVEMTDIEDTLIVVTADHSHVFTLGGYPSITNDIFGVVDTDEGKDGKPYLTLGYNNGPGYYSHRRKNVTDVPRKDVGGDNAGAPSYRFDAGVPLQYETHGGEDVGIYARGPMAHLFHGVHQQSYIAHVMMYASCVGKNKELCISLQKGSGSSSALFLPVFGVVGSMLVLLQLLRISQC